jgi:hypothetical protein
MSVGLRSSTANRNEDYGIPKVIDVKNDDSTKNSLPSQQLEVLAYSDSEFSEETINRSRDYNLMAKSAYESKDSKLLKDRRQKGAAYNSLDY